MKKPDNPPAFPVHGSQNDDPRNRILQGGMSLRDWFAGQALLGFVTCTDERRRGWSIKEEVKRAFEYADAMLAERLKVTRHD